MTAINEKGGHAAIERPCPDCRKGLCHRCGEERADAMPAPHMGVVLCSACFSAALFGGGR